MEYRQIIIARKDLEMNPGKLATQIAHASNAFMTTWLRDNTNSNGYVEGQFNKGIFDNWVNGVFVKTVCRAKNKNQLMKTVSIAEELGLKENEDFWLIKDNCATDLEPEEIDENGIGRTLTCIGFKPLPTDIAHKISKKFQLYV